jgi:orotidine-5'-phosphate decarboxylase
MSPRERLIVALDTPSAEAGRSLARSLRRSVGLVKVGSELYTAAGPGLVKDLVGDGLKVFLDLKFHDIPNTVAAAVSAACGLGMSLLSIHALAGGKALRAAVAARGSSPARLLAITVLTSHDSADLRSIGLEGEVGAAVTRLARLAQDSGFDGVVASPQESTLIRAACGPEFLIVSHGIRPENSALEDQARAATPAAALRAGADYLVVGRPITRAPDPPAAAEAIVEEMESAFLTHP